VLYAQQHKAAPMLGGMAGPPGLIQAPQLLAAPGQLLLQQGVPSRQQGALVAQPQVVGPGQVAALTGAMQGLQLQPVQPQVLLVPPPAQHQFQGQMRGGGGGGPGVMQPVMSLQGGGGRHAGGGVQVAYAPGHALGHGPGGGGGSLAPEGPTLFFDPATGMYYQQQFQQ
jgi:hypothetical protein